jgi:hypothetical protein
MNPGGQMNNTHTKYQYTIEDTINGLTITYKGRKSWWITILYLGLCCFVGYVMIDLLFDLFFNPSGRSDPFIIILILFACLVFIFVIYQLLVTALDALFDTEKININDQGIRIDKSGFSSFERSKVISTNGKICFSRLNSGQIYINKSKIIAQLFNLGLLNTYIVNPMSCCLRGMSVNDSISVLEKIKTKYPQYDINYQKSRW